MIATKIATKRKETYCILAVLVIILLGFTTTVAAIDIRLDLDKTYEYKHTNVSVVKFIDLWDLSQSRVEVLSTAGDNSDIQTIHTPQIRQVTRSFTTTTGTFEGILVTITGTNPSTVNWLTKPDYKIYTTPSVPTFSVAAPGKTGNPIVTRYNESWNKGTSSNLDSLFLATEGGYLYATGGLCNVNLSPFDVVCSGVFSRSDFDENDFNKTLFENRVSLDPSYTTDRAAAESMGLFREYLKASGGKYYISAISHDEAAKTTSVYALSPLVVLNGSADIRWTNSSGSYTSAPFTYFNNSNQAITLDFSSANPDIANIKNITYLFINDTVQYDIYAKIDTSLLAQKAKDRWENAFTPGTHIVDLLYDAIEHDVGTPFNYKMKAVGTPYPPASDQWSVIAITPGYGISGNTTDKTITIPAPNMSQLRNGLYDLYLMGTDGNNDIVALDQVQVRVAETVTPAVINKTAIGYYEPSTNVWRIDYNANGRWDGAVIDRTYVFGTSGVTPVTGDWNGDNRTEIGYYQPVSTYGIWRLDYNGNGRWDGAIIDRVYTFGQTGAVPVTGDWNNDGKTDIGYYMPSGTYSVFRVDYNGNGLWEGGVIDRVYVFGTPGVTPVSGDWNKDGRTEIGYYQPVSNYGVWRIDYNGNGRWDGAIIDRTYTFGRTGATPVSGDWDADTKTEIGYFLPYSGYGYFREDYNANGLWEGGVIDRVYLFGSLTGTPVTGKWQ